MPTVIIKQNNCSTNRKKNIQLKRHTDFSFNDLFGRENYRAGIISLTVVLSRLISLLRSKYNKEKILTKFITLFRCVWKKITKPYNLTPILIFFFHYCSKILQCMFAFPPISHNRQRGKNQLKHNKWTGFFIYYNVLGQINGKENKISRT